MTAFRGRTSLGEEAWSAGWPAASRGKTGPSVEMHFSHCLCLFFVVLFNAQKEKNPKKGEKKKIDGFLKCDGFHGNVDGWWRQEERRNKKLSLR